MSPAVASFISALRAFDPDVDPSAESTLYSLVDPVDGDASIADAFPEVFAFFERFPDADNGAPGPLVHLIESRIGEYEDLLVASLKRKPSATTVLMANRILNAHRSSHETSVLTALLADSSKNATASEYVREQAQHYLEFQKRG